MSSIFKLFKKWFKTEEIKIPIKKHNFTPRSVLQDSQYNQKKVIHFYLSERGISYSENDDIVTLIEKLERPL